MIDRAEILRLAGELSLRPEVVEKDYVLGWLLAGIAHNPALAGTWVFKGGTCLKKCYFETYRFSEDLDFTITDKAQLDRDFLVAQFTQIAAWLYDITGIEIPADQLRFDAWDTSRGSRAGEGRLYYRGPLARGGSLPRIKLDLTADEALVMLPVTRAVTHPYSDAPAEGLKALCYSYEEVFGEKVRALGERTRPRDLYDVVNLFHNGEFAAAAATIRRIVQAKCNFKKIPFPTLTTIEPARDELIGEWSNMLGHQLPALPPIDSFLAALPEFFKWLAGESRAARVGRLSGRTREPGVARSRRQHPCRRPRRLVDRGHSLRGLEPALRRSRLHRPGGQAQPARDSSPIRCDARRTATSFSTGFVPTTDRTVPTASIRFRAHASRVEASRRGMSWS